MTKILLISEDYIKTNSGLNDNVWGNYLTPAIREAQDIKLQQILGTSLYEAILEQVKNGAIKNDHFKPYKALLDDYIQPYLMYQTISDLVPIIGVKLTNIGVVVSNDEHLTNLTQGERELVQTYYGQRAEFYGKRLQNFLIDNRADYKELAICEDIKPTLDSVAETGLWLGGYRGRKLQ
jgi:hypothetical protein